MWMLLAGRLSRGCGYAGWVVRDSDLCLDWRVSGIGGVGWGMLWYSDLKPIIAQRYVVALQGFASFDGYWLPTRVVPDAGNHLDVLSKPQLH